MNNTKATLVIVLMIASMAVAFGIPKPKYVSYNIVQNLNIPMNFDGWQGKDVSNQLDIQGEGTKFISSAIARHYRGPQGQELILLLLDAGNFHNPKVCYTASGYVIKDLATTEFKTPSKNFSANSLYMEKDKTSMVVTYWLCINKTLVDWTGQKMQEFFYSLFNKKKTGLMVRIDVPTAKGSSRAAVDTAQKFIEEISKQMPKEEAEYLFGQ